MDFGFVHTVWTILLMGVFIGIVAWAYSSKRKDRFEKAAREPLDDDDAPGTRSSGETSHE